MTDDITCTSEEAIEPAVSFIISHAAPVCQEFLELFPNIFECVLRATVRVNEQSIVIDLTHTQTFNRSNYDFLLITFIRQ